MTEPTTQEPSDNRINYLGIQIHRKNPSWLSDLSKSLLSEGDYTRDGESIPQALARPAINFCYGDYALAQRIYDYVYKNWFMYASPVLSNATAGTWHDDPTKEGAHYWHKSTFIPNAKPMGQPISCFAFEVPDTIEGQRDALAELANLSVAGGGTGAHMSLRATTKKAPGPIPFEKVLDSAIGYFKQKGTRKGAVAAYLDARHPDIKEHVLFRVPGGDTKRRSDNRTQFHSGVNLPDDLIAKILGNDPDQSWELKCPHSGKVYETVDARALWEQMLETRALIGEPFMAKIDLINRLLPETQKLLGLRVRGSNLCSEVTLATDALRTFVCCLSSLNLAKFHEWKDTRIVEDLIRFLDNIIQWFIDTAPETMKKAKFSAERERALGLGAFGFHSFLQQEDIAFESGGFNSAAQYSHTIFKLIKERAVAESLQLGKERGEAPDMMGTGRRNSHLLALAPNANSADIANASPAMEPWYSNVFVKDTRAGISFQRNPALESCLEGYGKNTVAVWKSITKNKGSVQHLEFLSDHHKNVYKTAMEIDQHWIIEHADTRGPHICQAQSLNLWFPFGADRAYVNSVHLKFLRAENVKTLYYYRTEREVKVDNAASGKRASLPQQTEAPKSAEVDCLSCQG
jgi:ribonucleoside-diphosphate reductase alpha chain